jgi:hypothetical protein
MQPRYVCTLKLGYCSLSCGWMEIRVNIPSNITVCICYTQVRLLECLPTEFALHLTVCLLTNCCSNLNITSKWWYILQKGTYFNWMFGWKCLTSFCYHTKEVFENQVQLPLTFTLCGILHTHDWPHMTESTAIRPHGWSKWQLPFHCRLHFFMRKYSWCIR